MTVGNCILVALQYIGLVQASFFPYLQDQRPCTIYCNGAVILGNPNNCGGVFYSVCKIEGMNINISCVGTWNETISPDNKVDVKCTGLYSETVNGTTPGGIPGTKHFSCGGSLDVTYYITSPTSVVQGSSVNTTCNGKYAERLELTKSDNADTVIVGGENEFLDAPSGYTCAYMCGDIVYDGVFCQKDFKLTCSVDKYGMKSTAVYTCDDIFVGDWSGFGCVGNGKTISIGADYALTQTCIEYSGGKKLIQGEEKACVGTYFVSIAGFSTSQSILFAM